MAKFRNTAGGHRSGAQIGVGALVLGLVFLSWCVLVGGLSAVQHRGKLHGRSLTLVCATAVADICFMVQRTIVMLSSLSGG